MTYNPEFVSLRTRLLSSAAAQLALALYVYTAYDFLLFEIFNWAPQGLTEAGEPALNAWQGLLAHGARGQFTAMFSLLSGGFIYLLHRRDSLLALRREIVQSEFVVLSAIALFYMYKLTLGGGSLIACY